MSAKKSPTKVWVLYAVYPYEDDRPSVSVFQSKESVFRTVCEDFRGMFSDADDFEKLLAAGKYEAAYKLWQSKYLPEAEEPELPYHYFTEVEVQP